MKSGEIERKITKPNKQKMQKSRLFLNKITNFKGE